MADILSAEMRSIRMSKIRSKDTGPEMTVRRFLHSKGFRYKLHDKNLPGKPDLILTKYNKVVFIHGCFWHGHAAKNCKIAREPKTNVDYWRNKIATNRKRDNKNQRLLRKLGWDLIIVWECQLRGSGKNKTLQSIVKKIL